MTVWIRADRSVEPSSANVSKLDEITYVLTGNVEDGIVVERNGIVSKEGAILFRGEEWHVDNFGKGEERENSQGGRKRLSTWYFSQRVFKYRSGREHFKRT